MQPIYYDINRFSIFKQKKIITNNVVRIKLLLNMKFGYYYSNLKIETINVSH